LQVTLIFSSDQRVTNRTHRLVRHSITSHVVFEGDSWGETVDEFSHSLGHKQTISVSLPQRLLPGANLPLGPMDIRHFLERCGNSDTKSALPESGRSNH
jgi:hypothetical protein